jgi:hypothetical protein
MEAEMLQEQEEFMKLKDIRQLYLELMKVLHPDKEFTEEGKSWKQELTKDVITTYENKDILNLLQIEMLWLQKQGNCLSTLPLEKNKIIQQDFARTIAKTRI